MTKRVFNAPWKDNLETNRKKAGRVLRAKERGEYTPVGTPSNPPKKKAAS